MRPILALTAALALVAGCATAAASAPDVGPSRLLEDLRTLSADDMQGRAPDTEGGLKARAYLIQRLEELGVAAAPSGRLQPISGEVRRQSGTRQVSGANILGLIPGTTRPDRYIVVTAHYDHLGVHDDQIHNGADDNASGVSSVLELARQLMARPPEHSVLIVFFDAEESGLLGARRFVETPVVPLTDIALNLNLDMTSRAETDNHLWVTGTYQNPTFRPLLEPIAPVNGISLSFGKDRPEDTGANNWVEASDHGPFFRAGVPFIYLGVEFHPDYHQPTDDFDRVRPEVFTAATELAVRAFHALDQGVE